MLSKGILKHHFLLKERQLVFQFPETETVAEKEADFVVPAQGDDVADRQRVARETDPGRAGRHVPKQVDFFQQVCIRLFAFRFESERAFEVVILYIDFPVSPDRPVVAFKPLVMEFVSGLDLEDGIDDAFRVFLQ